MSANNPTCPDDCTAILPDVEYSDCAPEINNAQIRNLYIANVGYGLSDVTDAAEWQTRLAQTGGAANSIRKLTIVGDKPKPESTEKKISHDRIIKGKKAHTLNIEIDETNPTNYEMLRTLECGKQYIIWYEDEKYIYGGNDGIKASVNLDHIIDKDSQAIQLFGGDAKWTSQFHPERALSPLAA